MIVCEHNYLICIKKKPLFYEKWVLIHCHVRISPYLCIVFNKELVIKGKRFQERIKSTIAIGSIKVSKKEIDLG